MACFNKITSSQSQSFSAPDFNESGSFDGKIRAQKKKEPQVLLEEEFSKFGWEVYYSKIAMADLVRKAIADLRHERQIRKESQSREDICYEDISWLEASQPGPSRSWLETISKPSCESLEKRTFKIGNGFSMAGTVGGPKGKTEQKTTTFVHPNILKR